MNLASAFLIRNCPHEGLGSSSSDHSSALGMEDAGRGMIPFPGQSPAPCPVPDSLPWGQGAVLRPLSHPNPPRRHLLPTPLNKSLASLQSCASRAAELPNISPTSKALLIYVLHSTKKPSGYTRFIFPKKKANDGSPSINSSAGRENQIKGGESWGWRRELSLSLLALFPFLNGALSLDLLNIPASLLVESAERTRGRAVTAIGGKAQPVEN